MSLGQTFHRSYLAPAYATASTAGGAVRDHLKTGAIQAWSDSAANLPSGRTTLAAAGQTLQQMVTCGLPTYVREVAFMHAYSALADGLAKKILVVLWRCKRRFPWHRLPRKSTCANRAWSVSAPSRTSPCAVTLP
ncbi:hypothetical protein RHM58_19810 [Pseudomonas sp. 10S4]|uniref:hypothetical protein n=1 Tax=Pseudomonas sp. 10S4 TaxID=3048583 RepID=UPI002AC8A5BD|nr:hypothetical protein [Pseudomonas sp. 10S4]WPX16289.1 hypothetical protein RHM58_19810 [Pseudomonas sp. 10S4]